MTEVFSSQAELNSIAETLRRCYRLPVSTTAVPGAFLEAVLAHVRDGRVLPTYDYVDVVANSQPVGWSIKSTQAKTPMTWKRENREQGSSYLGVSLVRSWGAGAG